MNFLTFTKINLRCYFVIILIYILYQLDNLIISTINNSSTIKTYWCWFENLNINFYFEIDKLAILMLFLIFTVSFSVLIFAQNYLKTDPYLGKFSLYICFFIIFMIITVTSDNFLVLLFGWEGVGLCSYLLISFWSSRILANKAALKAIMFNRISDCFFIFAILLIYNCMGSLDFDFINLQLIHIYIFNFKLNLNNLISICIILAAFGKSAQFWFYIWLPEAMEGPTPISALIHAATMVTLGVFLIIRANCFPTFFSIEFSTSLVLFTFLLSSHIGIFEDDSKKAIAYSTCSHLSIMILACLDLNENLAFFHLINHGFFKALLFLSMGNIIHSEYPQEQDSDFFADEISFSIPITMLLFDLSILSLCSFFFTSASFSKEEIIDEDEWNESYFSFLIDFAILSSIISFDDIEEDIEEEDIDLTTCDEIIFETDSIYIISCLLLLGILSFISGIFLENVF